MSMTKNTFSMLDQADLPCRSFAASFKALSDPLRLCIIDLLQEQEFCVCDLCDRLGVAQSKISFHLKVLKKAGILHSRQQGKWMYYSLNPAQIANLERYLSDIRRFSVLSTSDCYNTQA
jgi:ArsR family transcriptional regulator